MREEFEPRSNMFPHTDGEVLNDEAVIIHSFGSIGEPEVFEPYAGVCLPDILGDVGRRSEATWEQHFLDAPAKGLWSRPI
jgi:hypothetical protein